MFRIIASFALMCSLIALIEADYQSVGVRGTLKCGDKPLAKTTVKLWDLDTLDPDDVLGCVHTDENGHFEVSGGEQEITDLDPVLKIYTNCNDEMLWGAMGKPCEREIRMSIPTSYINRGETVTRWFEADTMNMELKQDDEKRKCEIFDICDTLIGRIE